MGKRFTAQASLFERGQTEVVRVVSPGASATDAVGIEGGRGEVQVRGAMVVAPLGSGGAGAVGAHLLATIGGSGGLVAHPRATTGEAPATGEAALEDERGGGHGVVGHREEALPVLGEDKWFWISVSGLQKAIRRGLVEAALRCGFRLYVTDRARLYHRLQVILFEDIGLANLDLAFSGYELLSRKPSWGRVATLIRQMCLSWKCRDADCGAFVAIDWRLRRIYGRPAPIPLTHEAVAELDEWQNLLCRPVNPHPTSSDIQEYKQQAWLNILSRTPPDWRGVVTRLERLWPHLRYHATNTAACLVMRLQGGGLPTPQQQENAPSVLIPRYPQNGSAWVDSDGMPGLSDWGIGTEGEVTGGSAILHAAIDGHTQAGRLAIEAAERKLKGVVGEGSAEDRLWRPSLHQLLFFREGAILDRWHWWNMDYRSQVTKWFWPYGASVDEQVALRDINMDRYRRFVQAPARR